MHPTNGIARSTNRALRWRLRFGIAPCMAILVAFLLGIGNFAWHRAVIESGHAMVAEMPPAHLRIMRIGTLAFEFTLLCAALFMAFAGAAYWVGLYAVYSLMNGSAAWLIVTRRV